MFGNQTSIVEFMNAFSSIKKESKLKIKKEMCAEQWGINFIRPT